MAENSKIEWCDHTFNPWIGCVKVSDGCKYCYAEQLMDKRWNKVKWGPQGQRVRTSSAKWQEVTRWNARQTERRQRVFCASLADVFEDNPSLIEWRSELWSLVESTQNLDWLILTKRPENIMRMVPRRWVECFPKNIWLGTSVENQQAADERIPYLVRTPAVVKFLSCEPLLGMVDLDLRGMNYGGDNEYVHWVIAGGESGPYARPMQSEWVCFLRDQCVNENVPFFFKQWGGTNKKRAGRLLSGIEWNQFPEVV